MISQYRYFLACFFFIIISTSFFSCEKSQKQVEQLPDPQIKAEIAKVSGKLNDPTSRITSLIFRSQNPVTASESILEKLIEKDGSFCFEAPIECSTIFGSIYSPGNGGVLIELSSDSDIKVTLSVDSNGKLKIDNISGNNLLTAQDKENYSAVFSRYMDYPHDPAPVYKMTPEAYAHYQLDMIPKRIDYAMKDAKYSDAGKNFMINELKLFNLSEGLFAYKEWSDVSFRNSTDKEKPENWSPQEPDIHYYSFLKSFNLGNPQYLYSSYYSKIMKALFSATVLNIPPISDTPVEEWLSKVKVTLSGLVGFDTGQFYDLLAANAYAKQFNDEVTPLSDKQKNNIKEYFGDGQIVKILLRKNEEIIKLAEGKCAVVVNKTPDVPKEELMTAIISKYKNKAVLVDYWATWCGPCLDAMKRIDGFKSQLKDKNIVFVYITNGSSPQELWNKTIKSIPGEHYYLNKEEWESIAYSKQYGFDGIPTYLLFDSNGVLKEKLTGYPGNDKMQAMIEKLQP